MAELRFKVLRVVDGVALIGTPILAALLSVTSAAGWRAAVR